MTKVKVKFPIPSVLLIVFITLKLVGAIQWSWLWVLSPLWIPLTIAALCAVVGLLYCIFH